MVFVLLIFLLIGFITLAMFCGQVVLSILVFLCIKLPAAVFMLVLGMLLCCTILLIPLGIRCIRTSFKILT